MINSDHYRSISEVSFANWRASNLPYWLIKYSLTRTIVEAAELDDLFTANCAIEMLLSLESDLALKEFQHKITQEYKIPAAGF